MNKKIAIHIFKWLVFLSLLVPLIFYKELLFPLVSPKALWLRITLGSALPLYVYLLVLDKSLRPNLKNPLTLSIIAFWAINVITAITGINPWKSFLGNIERMGGVVYLTHLTLVYFYCLLLAAYDTNFVKQFIKGLIGAALATTIYGVLVYLGFPQLFPEPSFPRISSTFGNPIFFASFLIFPAFLCSILALQAEQKWKKGVYWFLVVFQLIGIYLSITRGALVGLVLGSSIAAFVYLFHAPSKKIKKVGFSLVVILLLLGAGVFSVRDKFTPGSVPHRFTHYKDTNTVSRIIQWRAAMKGFSDRPVSGYGNENYYYVANKYFDRVLYKNDASWFDKPHNYTLEVLVTNGIFGLLAYAAIIIFSLYAFYRSYKYGFISWLEYCVALAAILTYQIQNFFVFDTVSASLAFWVFTGLAGMMWWQTEKQEQPEKKSKARSDLSLVVLSISVVLMLYYQYALNFAPAKVMKAINYGYATNTNNPVAATKFFQDGMKLPFNIDPGEYGSKYEEFIVNLAQMPEASRIQFARGYVNQYKSNPVLFASQTPDFLQKIGDAELKGGPLTPDKDLAILLVNANIDKGIEQLEYTVKVMDNNPIYFYKLGNLYLTRSIFNRVALDPRAEQNIRRAIELVPERTEPRFFLAQIKALQGDAPGALAVTQEIYDRNPDNNEVVWRYALALQDNGRTPEAVQTAEIALSKGYKPRTVPEHNWLTEAYVKTNQFQKALEMNQMALVKEPNNTTLYMYAAKIYKALGDKEKALTAINQYLILAPAETKVVDEFKASLQ